MKNFLRKLFSGLLALLGFSAVGCDGTRFGPDEYGTPTTEYSIKGKVVDASGSGKGIPGIRMIFSGGYYDGSDIHYNDYYNDTLFTVSDGSYQYDKRLYGGNSVVVFMKDVDGELNGSYKADSVVLTFDRDEYKRVSNWVSRIEKSGIYFSLRPGSDEPDSQPDSQDE